MNDVIGMKIATQLEGMNKFLIEINKTLAAISNELKLQRPQEGFKNLKTPLDR